MNQRERKKKTGKVETTAKVTEAVEKKIVKEEKKAES